MTSQTEALVVRKAIAVAVPPERAFALFTERIDTWWPLDTHSLGGERAQAAVFETFAGGRVFERMTDGEEALWGRILEWDPPRRVSFSWEITQPATEIDVRFAPEGEGTRVELEHRGWERLETDRGRRDSYDTGWNMVLGRYLEASGEAR